MPAGRWVLIAAHYSVPYYPPDVPHDAREVRQSLVPAASNAAGPAVLREYHIARDAGHRLAMPGADEVTSFSISPHKLDLLVPLGPGTWLVLEANLENAADREELIRVLRSARWVDR